MTSNCSRALWPVQHFYLYIVHCDCMEAHGATKENPLRRVYLQHLANDEYIFYIIIRCACMNAQGGSTHGKPSAPLIRAPTHC